MAELSLSDDQVRNSTLDQLVDMLNDELPSVRLHTAKSLANLVESSGPAAQCLSALKPFEHYMQTLVG